MSKVQSIKPARSAAEPRAKYVEYRPTLRADFNQSCGYCDASDKGVDSICFHIDHFAPQSKFITLSATYTNLVYACRFCNIRKSNHWVGLDPMYPNDGESGFVDPCSDEYDEHLERHHSGRIIARTTLGAYMIKRLNLNLLRHELLWRSRRAQALTDEIDRLIEKRKAKGIASGADYISLLERFHSLTKLIRDYELRAVGQ